MHSQRLTQKDTCLYEKTVRSGTAKKPVPVRVSTSSLAGDNRKVFFISLELEKFKNKQQR